MTRLTFNVLPAGFTHLVLQPQPHEQHFWAININKNKNMYQKFQIVCKQSLLFFLNRIHFISAQLPTVINLLIFLFVVFILVFQFIKLCNKFTSWTLVVSFTLDILRPTVTCRDRVIHGTGSGFYFWGASRGRPVQRRTSLEYMLTNLAHTFDKY